MFATIDLRGRRPDELTRAALHGVLPRAVLDVAAAAEQVRPLCEDVRRRGAVAVREYTRRFDGVDLATTRVPAGAIDEALGKLDEDVRTALTEAVRRTTLVHQAQLRGDTTTTVADGLTVTGRFVPVGRAGVYVPGGLTAYPSSVIMNVIPAQVAGVTEIAVASPPQVAYAGCRTRPCSPPARCSGSPRCTRPAAPRRWPCWPTAPRDCAPVDVVTGPGNIYVAAAKRVLRGVVGTDAENGPTEIAIVADHTADPVHLAADLISQAEHDPLAACLLVTPEPALPGAVGAELARRVPRPATASV